MALESAQLLRRVDSTVEHRSNPAIPVMAVNVLGPLTVECDGHQVDLGSRQQRSLFALLLICANDPVSLERIVDQLWPSGRADRTNAVRVYVSRLRAALEPHRRRGEASILETHGNGYLLRVDADRYDVARFERLVAEGRAQLLSNPTSAAAKLRTALELWRGAAFGEVTYNELAENERERLAEMRIDALEDRIEADLASGQSGRLVSEIEVLRRRHPLRERLVGHHMLALYRAGRPAEALRTMTAFRCFLGEELGVGPSPILTRLEQQVLLHGDAIQPRRPLGDPLNSHTGNNPQAVRFDGVA